MEKKEEEVEGEEEKCEEKSFFPLIMFIRSLLKDRLQGHYKIFTHFVSLEQSTFRLLIG